MPRLQYLIYRKWFQYTLNEGVECYWQVIDQMEI